MGARQAGSRMVGNSQVLARLSRPYCELLEMTDLHAIAG